MRLLVVHPGADWATCDVHVGLTAALRRRGHEVLEYPLDQRIARARSWLDFNYQAAAKADPTIAEPTFADMLYLAGERVLPLALRAQVDWVLVVSGMYFHPDHLILMQRAGLRTALLLTETPYDQDKEARVLPHVDVAWTNERSSVPFLRTVNPNTAYLPHAYDPDVHRPDGDGWLTPAGRTSAPQSGGSESGGRSRFAVADTPLSLSAIGTVGDDRGASEYSPDVPAHDVVFVGTAFQERIETLEAVDWAELGIDLGLYGNWTDALPEGHPLRQYVRAETVPNAYAAALYRRAKVGLNLYRTSMGFGPDAPRIAHAESLNPRALELAACGAFHLSDYRAEVSEVFGDLVPTFHNGEHLAALLRHWLPRAAERAAVAAQLPACVEGRSFDAMAAQVEEGLTCAVPARMSVEPVGAAA